MDPGIRVKEGSGGRLKAIVSPEDLSPVEDPVFNGFRRFGSDCWVIVFPLESAPFRGSMGQKDMMKPGHALSRMIRREDSTSNGRHSMLPPSTNSQNRKALSNSPR